MTNPLLFSDLFLSEELLRAITEMGYETPSPIQYQAIPSVLEGLDVIGQAQTGTGKTAAFGLPILDKINPSEKKVQALILCPTRELCVQITGEIEKMAKYKKDIKVLSIYGGDSMMRQTRGLKDGAQIVAGTPGRVMDHLRRGSLKINNLKIVVLDEADEMLNMGFREDIETILVDTPDQKQTVLFSATMSKPIMDISKKFLNEPRIIKVMNDSVAASTIEQMYFETRGNRKSKLVADLIQMHDFKLSLVFCNTKARTDSTTEELREAGLKAEALHGDLNQNLRNQVLNRFKKNEINILVATDVAARGLDVNNVDAVFNFDLPHDNEYYVHRIGRTGRAGKTGKAFSFAESRKDDRKIMELERFIKMRITRENLPNPADLIESQLARLESTLMAIATENHLADYEKVLQRMYQNGFDPHLLAACLLKSKLDEQGIKLNVPAPVREPRKERDRDRERERTVAPRYERDDSAGSESKVRMHIAVGRKDRIKPGDIVGAITGECKISGREIGVIDMFDHFSYFEISENQVKKVLRGWKKSTIKGKKAILTVARN